MILLPDFGTNKALSLTTLIDFIGIIGLSESHFWLHMILILDFGTNKALSLTTLIDFRGVPINSLH